MGVQERREWGSGSVYQRSDGRWIARIELPRGPEGRRKQKTVSGKRREDVATAFLPKVVLKRGPYERHNATRLRYIRGVLQEAVEQGWGTGEVAAVLLAALAPLRVYKKVFGPCHYCGSWRASTVDHVLPRVRGGTDDAANLVSACLSCNSAKSDRTPEEWRAA